MCFQVSWGHKWQREFYGNAGHTHLFLETFLFLNYFTGLFSRHFSLLHSLLCYSLFWSFSVSWSFRSMSLVLFSTAANPTAVCFSPSTVFPISDGCFSSLADPPFMIHCCFWVSERWSVFHITSDSGKKLCPCLWLAKVFPTFFLMVMFSGVWGLSAHLGGLPQRCSPPPVACLAQLPVKRWTLELLTCLGPPVPQAPVSSRRWPWLVLRAWVSTLLPGPFWRTFETGHLCILLIPALPALYQTFCVSNFHIITFLARSRRGSPTCYIHGTFPWEHGRMKVVVRHHASLLPLSETPPHAFITETGLWWPSPASLLLYVWSRKLILSWHMAACNQWCFLFYFEVCCAHAIKCWWMRGKRELGFGMNFQESCLKWLDPAEKTLVCHFYLACNADVMTGSHLNLGGRKAWISTLLKKDGCRGPWWYWRVATPAITHLLSEREINLYVT